ncbi:MAG: nucleotidyltransferase family protein [bacterium]
MSKNDLIKLLSELNVEIIKKYKGRIVGLFGSYARGEETEKSDIDILVENGGEMTLFDLGGLKIYLEEKLKHEVDVATIGGLKKELKPYIMRDIIYI